MCLLNPITYIDRLSKSELSTTGTKQYTQSSDEVLFSLKEKEQKGKKGTLQKAKEI